MLNLSNRLFDFYLYDAKNSCLPFYELNDFMSTSLADFECLPKQRVAYFVYFFLCTN